MPDGDVVHDTLSPQWLTVYEQICEWDYGPEEVAHRAVRTLRDGIKRYGDAPLQLIKEVVSEFKKIPDTPLLRQGVDLEVFNQEIERQARKTDGSPRGIALAKDACKKKLLALQDGETPKDVEEETISLYVAKVYNADFRDRVPLTKRHHNDVNPATIQARLAEIDPYVQKGRKTFVIQLMQHGTTSRLRMRPRRKKRVILLDNMDLSKPRT